MDKKTLHKDIRKSITKSKGRFVSILLLMALGSFALTGLFVTGPDMRKTGENYFKTYNTSDLTILSDYGITKDDQKVINQTKNIKDIEYIYLKDVTLKNSTDSFRLFSKPKKVSKYEIVEGRLPNKNNEIAIASNYQDTYNIGDTIQFVQKDSHVLKRTSFKIVGFVNSTEIISNVNRGSTTAGTGSLKGYGIVNEDVFDSDVFMMAKLTFKDTHNLDPYSDTYTNKIQAHKKDLEKDLKKQPNIRLQSIQSEYQEKIDEGQSKIDDAKNELSSAKAQLQDAKNQIDEGKSQISENEKKLQSAYSQIKKAQNQIQNSEKQLASKQAEYDAKVNEYQSKLNAYNEAASQIQNSQSEVDSKIAQLENGKSQYETGIQQLKGALAQIQNDPTLSDEQKQIQSQAIQAQLDSLQNEYSAFMVSYKENVSQLHAAQEQINAKSKELSDVKSQLDLASAQLNDAKSQLNAGYAQINSAKSTLNSSIAQYQSGISQLNIAKNQLAEKESEYNEKKNEYNAKEPDALKKIQKAEDKLSKSKEKLNQLSKPIYTVDTRREIPGGDGYKIYESVSDIVDSLAKVFPIFLYFVAALVTLTTMTRFVDEERINSGTLKALGYQDADIIKKFTIYGFISSSIGTILGITLGHTLLPYIIYNAYSHGFSVPQIEWHFYPVVTLCAIVLSLLSAVLPSYVVAKKELNEHPATLLLPKAPVSGEKIFLERIKPLWSRLSFTHKVTARNIFRYKKRMFMTIFGVAGSVTLLFAGFGVQHSISEIKDRQFGSIIKYDMIVAENMDTNTKKLYKMLDSSQVKEYTKVYYDDASIQAGDKNDRSEIKVIIPETEKDFSKYIGLDYRKTKEKISFSDDGVVISERLADLLHISKGDTFTYTDSNNHKRTVKVSDICEMYTGHFIFMNKAEYEKVYKTSFTENAFLVNLKDNSLSSTEKVSSRFMRLNSVKGVVQNTTLTTLIDTIVESLNKIMEILILVATLLSIVILYNLTNINVSERIRELSTIKVLGFYENEVTMYIYRETILLSILGVIVGWMIGIWLHHYILVTVPPEEVMFNPARWIGAYIIPLILIFIVLFILKYFINKKLKNVDMLEALKSVD